MRKLIRVVAPLILFAVVMGALPALAAPTGTPTVEVKAAKGVENHEPVGAGDQFAAGDKVWIWTHVTGADGTKIKHVWMKDGKEEWTAILTIGSSDWRTNSRREVSAGSWTVQVQTEDGTKLGEVSFTVSK
jgi:hypothetical protein